MTQQQTQSPKRVNASNDGRPYVNPLVWQAALALAQGDEYRIHILGEDEVIVVNAS
jgi:hypothetical protein